MKRRVMNSMDHVYLGFATEGFNEYDNNNGENSKTIKIRIRSD